MKSLVLLLTPSSTSSFSLPHNRLSPPRFIVQYPRFRRLCSSNRSQSIQSAETDTRPEYKAGVLDELFLHFFRNRMVKEVGWDSEKPGYDGLIEVARHLMMGRSTSETRAAAVRILKSLFPHLFFLELYRILITPIQGGKVAAEMVGRVIVHFADFRFGVLLLLPCLLLNFKFAFTTFFFFGEARVTVRSCQWLMGCCTVNSVELPDGSLWESGVFVERCKYLDESKCVGICINTCKLPTQTFIKDYMGIPLLMEPNFTDCSCQFKFGVLPPTPEDDSALKEPCLEICPNATRRRELPGPNLLQCPKA